MARAGKMQLSLISATTEFLLNESVIERIYDGVLEEPPWGSLVEHCRLRTQSVLTSLFFHWASREEYAGLEMGDRARLVTELRKTYLERFAPLDPIPYSSLQAGRVHRIEDFVPRDQLEQSVYFREFLHPAGLDYFLTVHVAEPSGFKIWINLGRPADIGPYSADEHLFLEGLIPHLQRALALFAVRKRLELERDVYRDLVENLTIGALAVDREGRIVSSNRAADRLIETSELLAIRDRRLRIKSPRQAEAFNAALQQIVTNQTSVAAVALGEGTAGHGGLGLLLRTLGPFRNFGDGSLPSAVVYLSDTAANRIGPASLVAELFDLTATESSLAILLARGQSLADAAMELGVTESSVRTYLKRIFAKTGLHRQAELVALILQSVAVLSPDKV